MYYRLRRHVIFSPQTQETVEAWGIDRAASGISTTTGPRSTDECDPLRTQCPLLLLHGGHYVTWNTFFEWLSSVPAYTLVSGFENLTPYSTLVISGP